MEFICLFITNSLGVKESLKLYFKPNSAGLFSHFLVMKNFHHLAQQNNRYLVQLSFVNEHHYGESQINMCEIFILPNSILCDTLPSNITCHKHLPSNLSSFNGDFCYIGRLDFNHSVYHIHRLELLSAVNFDVPLEFREDTLKLYPVFKEALGIKDNENFTVAHWRRGDQIEKRCLKKLDNSVNCKSAETFIKKVMKNTNDSIVYIATNENINSFEMKIIHNYGYKYYNPIFFENYEILKNLTSLQILTLETKLMTDSTTFLGWGLSEVNDVVEHERFKRNKSYCINQPHSIYDRNQYTWCYLYGNLTKN